jgi:hypothetical protein
MDRRLKQQWSTVLPLVQRMMNATPHRVTGTTPVRMLYGDRVDLNRALLRVHGGKGEGDEETASVGDRVNPDESKGSTEVVEDYVQQLILAQSNIIEVAQQHQRRVIEARLKDSPANPTQFEPGDHVLVTYPNRPPNKLMARWRGPMVVVERKGNTHMCQDLCTLKVIPFDVSRLKLYNMQHTQDAVALAAGDNDEYEVEAIVGHTCDMSKRGKRRFSFKVRWKGYEPEDDTWLTYKEVSQLEALDAYLQLHPELKL